MPATLSQMLLSKFFYGFEVLQVQHCSGTFDLTPSLQLIFAQYSIPFMTKLSFSIRDVCFFYLLIEQLKKAK